MNHSIFNSTLLHTALCLALIMAARAYADSLWYYATIGVLIVWCTLRGQHQGIVLANELWGESIARGVAKLTIINKTKDEHDTPPQA